MPPKYCKGFAPAPVSSQTNKLATRDEIEEKYKWHIRDVYYSDEDWEKDFKKLKNAIFRLDKYRGKLGESADNLLGCMIARDRLETLLGKLSIYANLKFDEDTRLAKYQAFRDRISGLAVQLSEKTAFIQPEILSLPGNKLRRFVKSNQSLNVYRHYFEDLLRSKDHVLSREEEQILALSGEVTDVPYQVFSMFNNADLKFQNIKDESGKEVELTKGNYSVFMRSSNRRVRETAYNTMYITYNNWINTLATSLSGAENIKVLWKQH